MRTTRRRTNLAAPAAAAFLLLALGLRPPAEARAQWTTDTNAHTITTTTDKVGVGTAGPEYRLHVQGDSTDTNNYVQAYFRNTNTARPYGGVAVDGQSQSHYRFMLGGALKWQWRVTAGSGGDANLSAFNWSLMKDVITLKEGGGVGVGTDSPGLQGMSNTLTVQGATTRGMLELSTAQPDAPDLVTGQMGFFSPGNTGGRQVAAIAAVTNGATAGNRGGDLFFFTKPDGGELALSMRLSGGGNLGIGVAPGQGYRLDVNGAAHVSGDMTVDGNIAAKYQDVAEWVPSVRKLAPGTVVVLDTGRTNHVLASSGPYDTKVAGVVSAEPGVILGTGGEGKVKVATTGRVKVKVDASRGAIRVGDLLVTSDVEGVAMRSVPVELGGVSFHRPGTIIGKALEPLERGVGEILVLLSLQ